jgi:hypothetical protein
MMAPLVRLLLSTTMKVMLMLMSTLMSTAMKKDLLALLKVAVAMTMMMQRWTMTMIEEMTGCAPAAHLQRCSFGAVLVLVWITTTQR